MNKKRKILFMLVLVQVVVNILQAQDLHFSQFFNAPLTVNPANTGFIPDADYRLGVHYRNQWSSILAKPYKTISAFADAQLMREKLETGWLGVGAFILSDEAGTGSLKSTKVYGSLAYHQMLGLSSLVSAGFNLGWANKRINQTNLKFPDQFDGKFFDNTLPTSVSLVSNSVSYFDMQIGMNYAYFPTEEVYINAGYSIHHVNRPKETFFGSGDEAKLPMRHIGFINALLKASDRFILNPNLYYTSQAKSREFLLGLNANYNLSQDGDKQLIAGVYYRYGDAFIPMLGFELKNIRFTFSYDATTSALKNYNNMRGASEFNLLKKGFYSEDNSASNKVMCPKF